MPEEKATKTLEAPQHGSILMGVIWMALISLLLFWFPVIGPLIAGVVGGKVAGGVGAGLMAALLPCLFFGLALFVFAAALTGLPSLGVLAGAGGLILVLSQTGMLLLGAAIGGLLA